MAPVKLSRQGCQARGARIPKAPLPFRVVTLVEQPSTRRLRMLPSGGRRNERRAVLYAVAYAQGRGRR